MKRILFLCTGNSCRSQIAEAWTRHLKGDTFEAYSAGVEPREVDSKAIKVMAEVGISLKGNESKGLDSLQHLEFEYVITLCNHARETCPFFPAKTRLLHMAFDDPPELARTAGDEEEALHHYRRVREEIRAFVEGMPENLKED